MELSEQLREAEEIFNKTMEEYQVALGNRDRDRRDKLWEVQEKDEEIRRLGFYDRLGARCYWLHVQGFYEGSLDEKAVAVELAKVKEFMEDVKLVTIGKR